MKAILFEDLKLQSPTRSIDDIVKIIDELKPDIIIRGLMRFPGSTWTSETFDNVKLTISTIKQKYPNIIIIGNLFFQLIGKAETDDITLETYTSDYIYNNVAFDPLKFGITDITKCEYQCYGNNDTICTCKGPGETQSRNRYIPDITIQLTQTLYVHQAELLIKAGCDGVWIDGLMFNSAFLMNHSGSENNIMETINASFTVCNKIREIKTNYGKTPLISYWYNSAQLPYFKKSSLWYPKFFDYITIAAPNGSEMRELLQKQDYTKIRNTVNNDYGNVPIIAYIDWGFGKHPLWYFSQWYPGYTDCCSATDTPANRIQRHKFQQDVLKTFTKVFTEHNIIWAYHVHGGGTCQSSLCTDESLGACCVKSYGLYHVYDSQAPEHQTYDTILKLMNPYIPITPTTSTAAISIKPLLLAAVGTGAVYVLLDNIFKKNRGD